MVKYLKTFLISCLLAVSGLLAAQNSGSGDGIFNPISKYIQSGDAESLSAWFADNLEITVLGNTSDCSKSQARQIMKSFFKTRRPDNFSIEHIASREEMKSALGILRCGADAYSVTIFVSCKGHGRSFLVHQMKIDALQ